MQQNGLGVLAVVEAEAGIVLVHPPSGTPEAPASLPGGAIGYGETPEEAVIRITREQTGLEVEIVGEVTRFLQEGTPFGPVLIFGFAVRQIGGALVTEGPEGPAVAYPIDSLPAIIPIRAANKRVLATYLEEMPAR